MATKTDLIFTGGLIFTAASKTPERLGVAVSDGRIKAIASEADVCAMATENTRLVDLEGAL